MHTEGALEGCAGPVNWRGSRAPPRRGGLLTQRGTARLAAVATTHQSMTMTSEPAGMLLLYTVTCSCGYRTERRHNAVRSMVLWDQHRRRNSRFDNAQT